MASPKLLQMPSDPSSEIYLNPQNLSVDFRSKQTSKATYNKMLRVVVQAYGQTIEDKFFKPGTAVTFGIGMGNLIQIGIPNLPNRHPLITYLPNGAVTLRLSPQFSGIVQTNDKLSSLTELQKSKGGAEQVVELSTNSRGAVEQGHLRIYFEEIEDPEKIVPIPFAQTLADREFGRWLAVSLALHLLLLLLIKILPSPSQETKLEDLPKSFQKILVSPQEVKEYKPLIVADKANTAQNNNPSFAKQTLKGGGREGEGARAAGTEGRRGKSEPGVQRPSLEKVKNAGALSFFANNGKAGGFNDLVNGSLDNLANNLAKSSGRYGIEGENEVRQGKGNLGSGTGGGGKTTSIGNGLSTQGRGGGAKGDGLADFGTGKSRTAVVASIDAESATVVGSLSKDQIAKVIAAYMGQIQYCYERQLQREPKIRGKIIVRFVIGLSGAVTSAETQASTMGSPPVESCINAVFKRMPFPSPGAGVVEASYPLVFNVAG